ncbi:MAG: hypothetical protein ABI488_14115 [Polyangiaceae bacterium]
MEDIGECLDANAIAASGNFGTSKANCPAAVEAVNPCDELTACDAGKTYDAAQATKCTNAIDAATCSDTLNDVSPAECNDVCKAASASGTSGSSGTDTDTGGDTATGPMGSVTECKKNYQTQCDQLFKCASADQLAANADLFGTTPEECEALFEGDTPCEGDPCGGAGTFDGAQAEKCFAAYTAQTCTAYLDESTPDPVECGTVCK